MQPSDKFAKLVFWSNLQVVGLAPAAVVVNRASFSLNGFLRAMASVPERVLLLRLCRCNRIRCGRRGTTWTAGPIRSRRSTRCSSSRWARRARSFCSACGSLGARETLPGAAFILARVCSHVLWSSSVTLASASRAHSPFFFAVPLARVYGAVSQSRGVIHISSRKLQRFQRYVHCRRCRRMRCLCFAVRLLIRTELNCCCRFEGDRVRHLQCRLANSDWHCW